jgi:hypothetical protein
MFGEPFRKNDGLEMTARVGQADNAHLAAGAGSALDARYDSRRDATAVAPAFTARANSAQGCTRNFLSTAA